MVVKMKHSVKCFLLEVSHKLAVNIDQLCIERGSSGVSKIAVLLQSIVNGAYKNVGQLMKAIEMVQLHTEESDETFVGDKILELYCNLYILCLPKHPCKKSYAKLLSASKLNPDDVSLCLHKILNDSMDGNCSDSSIPISHFVQTIEHLCQSCPHVLERILNTGLEFIAFAVRQHQQELKSLSENAVQVHERTSLDICDDLKCATVIMQKHFKDHQITDVCRDDYKSIINSLIRECQAVLQNDNLEWECWNAAGLLLPYLLQANNPLQDQLCNEMLQILAHKNDDFEPRNLCDGAFVGLCNGFLVLINSRIIKHQNGYQRIDVEQENQVSVCALNMKPFTFSLSQISLLLHCIFQNLFSVSERITSVTNEIALAKCFVQWSLTARNFAKEGKLQPHFLQLLSDFGNLQTYIEVSLDHPVDVIRHQARDVMVNVIATRSNQTSDPSPYVEDLIGNVSLWDWHKRSVYVSFLCVLDHVSVDFMLKTQPKLIEKLLAACCSQSLAPYASQVYSQLALKHKEISTDTINQQIEKWLKPAVKKLLECEPQPAKIFLEYCLKKLLKFYRLDAVKFIANHVKQESTAFNHRERANKKLSVLIMCLRSSQRLGLLQELTNPCLSDGKKQEWKESIDIGVIKTALVHENDQVRLDSFSLVCESWKPTVLVSSSDIELFQYALPFNMNCQCPAFRQNLRNIVIKFINRLQLNTDSLTKKKKSDSNSKQLLSLYSNFKRWMFSFCFDQLFIGASYPRKNLSFNILHSILSSCIKTGEDLDYVLKCCTTKRVFLLVGLLKDSYEENRQISLSILTNPALKIHVKRILGDSFLYDLLRTSLDDGRRSFKPEVCRDAAYNLRFLAGIYDNLNENIVAMSKYFVFCLRDDVKVAGKNLRKAVETGPMHGCLHCLRLLLSDADFNNQTYVVAYSRILSECIDLCYEVADAVYPIVASDSPEGCIPCPTEDVKLPAHYRERYHALLCVVKDNLKADADYDEDQLYVGQKTLVNCWRSAKESYLLLQLICSRVPPDLSDATGALLSPKQFLEIGEHLRTQLMETVHRGTFEVAYAAFRAYCPLLWRSKHAELNARPKQWIKSTLKDVSELDRAKLICATRRSAGLPFLLQALLGCDRGQVSRDCLHHVISSLLPLVDTAVLNSLKTDEECVRQIHIMNIFRGLMRDASLGEEMLPYLSPFFIAAITGFGSKIWTIRNSSTLLFSALLSRLFGVKREKDLETSGKNRLSSHEFFTRMPRLHEFLLERLKMHLDDKENEFDIEKQSSLYPVLLLLSRVYSSSARHQSSNDALASYIPLLIRCGHSPILKCRVMTATALTSIVPIQSCPDLLRRLASTFSTLCSSNQLHGTILLMKKIVASKIDECEYISDDWKTSLLNLVNTMCEKKSVGSRLNSCAPVRAEFINLTLEVASIMLQSNLKSDFDDLQISRDIKSLLTHLVVEGREDVEEIQTSYKVGHTMLFESIGRLSALCFLWEINSETIHFILHSGKCDVIYAALSLLKKQLKVNKMKDLKKTGFYSKLENTLLWFVSSDPDIQCLAKAYTVLSFIVSSLNCDQAICEMRRLADKTLHQSEKLAGAVVTCQAICLAGIFERSRPLTKKFPGHIVDCVSEWIIYLKRACSSDRHDASVTSKVADALRTVAVDLLVDAQKILGPVCIDAWAVLFTLLVDEDEGVRKSARQSVYQVVRSCNPIKPAGEVCVDMLSLEMAMDCFVKLHGKKYPEQFETVLDHVTLLADNELAEDDPHVGASVSQLFDRGAANTFVEGEVLLRLVQKARTTCCVNLNSQVSVLD